jgi:pimeloyl-ACP methyl ester carboxylesterase
MSRVWLLPGMDGTGRLFGPLLRQGETVRYEAVRYEGSSYDAIERALPASLLRPDPNDILVAESFGGPLALRIAARHPVARVVLIASFVRPPRPFLPSAPIALFHPPPRLMIRLAMLGIDAESALVDEVRAAIGEVPASTLRERMEAMRDLDARDLLAAARAKVVWLRATQDRLVPASATALARSIRNDLEVHDVDGPHLLVQRFPERVAPFLGEG